MRAMVGWVIAFMSGYGRWALTREIRSRLRIRPPSISSTLAVLRLPRNSRSCSLHRRDHTCWTWGRDWGEPRGILQPSMDVAWSGSILPKNIAVLPPNWQNTWDCRILSNIGWGTFATFHFRTNHSM